MFRKLQRKFLWGSTLVLLLVISLVVGLVYWATSHTIARQTQVMIGLILDNDGVLPEQNDFDPDQETFLAFNDETVHEARYFSVRFEGDEAELVSSRIALPTAEILALARQVREQGRNAGSLSVDGRHTLYYALRAADDGTVLAVFVDSTSRNGLKNLVMVYMSGLWSLVLLLYFLLMRHFSKKLVQPFVENDERQKRFITNASHELKTPLAVISANNEMAQAIGGKTKWTESTARQVKRLQSLIEDLVVLARLGEMEELTLTEVDFSALVTEAAESFRPAIEGAGKTFSCEIEPEVKAPAEKRTLQQIVTILLDNAMKYCDDGGQITLGLKHRGKNKGAVLTVSNPYAAGQDVDPSRFFERFYRQDESHHSGKSGFGIGLSMAKEMTERMKGKIRAGITDGIITFTVEL